MLITLFSVSFHDPGTSSEIFTNFRLSIRFTSRGGRSWKFTISGSASRIVGGFDAMLGELKGTMTDDVSPPPMLNAGKPNRCAVGGSIPRPVKNCADCKYMKLHPIASEILSSMGWIVPANSYYYFITFLTALYIPQICGY